MNKRENIDPTRWKRIVVKVGTSVLTSKEGKLETSYISRLVHELASLQQSGREVILVTSGAISAGMGKLQLIPKPKTIPLKQAAAAVGQSILMQTYEHLFSQHHQPIAQILLTHQDLSNRQSYINIYNTILTLLHYRVIPIINENDTVAVEEIKFGDNDTLSALVAHSIEADLLIILTDTDGLYDTNPKHHKPKKLISVVEKVTPEILGLADGEGTPLSTGGMYTKLKAAEIVTKCGVVMIIANGREERILERIVNGESVGTLFLPLQGRMAGRKRWIAFNLNSCGEIVVDEGARKAILFDGRSLLPSGVVGVEGEFEVGDAVTILDEQGKELAKGLTNYSALELCKIKGKHTREIERVLGYKYFDEVIHRDNLVLLR
jgi:glutamate 5-kinase